MKVIDYIISKLNPNRSGPSHLIDIEFVAEIMEEYIHSQFTAEISDEEIVIENNDLREKLSNAISDIQSLSEKVIYWKNRLNKECLLTEDNKKDSVAFLDWMEKEQYCSIQYNGYSDGGVEFNYTKDNFYELYKQGQLYRKGSELDIPTNGKCKFPMCDCGPDNDCESNPH